MVLASEPMSGVSGRKWRLRGRFPDGELEGAPFEPLIRHLLWHRGVASAGEAIAFMAAADPGHDPALLPDVARALERIRRALRAGELIAVYGDFDVDGVTSSAILLESLRDLGANVLSYIPDRFSEGYGLSERAVRDLAGRGVTLIITADCGTSSRHEISFALERGVDVIVVDHHTVPPELPPAVAVVNPKRPDSLYPEPELATGGLAYKVMAALYESLSREWDAGRYLDLAALSTVCDMAPLRGENRWFVREGIRALAASRRPGVRALLEAAGCERVDADTIAFTLGPRLNAAGRLAHAERALRLLTATDEASARELALELSQLNYQRQQATAAAMELARELLAQELAGQPLIFIGHENIPAGIVGLVAGRLTEEHNRPAVVYEKGNATSRASCRSIPEFDIAAALRACAPLLVRFGGHRAAAGFTAENENLPALKDALVRAAGEGLRGVDLTPVIDIDAAVPLGRVNGALIRGLAALAPHGVGNPEPVFLSRGVEVTGLRVMGDDGRHLRLSLKDGRVTWPAVAFGFGAEDLVCGERLDVVYTFGAGRGEEGAMELRVVDFARSAA